MVEITPTSALVGTGLALAGAEATGVTNFTGSASDKEDQSGGDTSSVIDSLLAGVQIGQVAGGGSGGVGTTLPSDEFDLNVDAGDGEGLTPDAQDGGFLGRGGLLTAGDTTDDLVPDADDITDDSNDDNRTPGDASDRGSEFGGDPLGWNSDRVTEVAEDEAQGFIGGVFETGGNVLEGAVAGAGAGAVGGSVIPGAGTLAGAGIGAVGGGLTGLFGDPSDMAVDTGEATLDAGGDVINDVTGGGSSDASNIEDESSPAGAVDTDGDGKPDASMVIDPEPDVDTSSSDGGSTGSRGGISTGSTSSSPDASEVGGDEPDVSGGSSGGSSSIPGAVDTDGDGSPDASMPTDEPDLSTEPDQDKNQTKEDDTSSGGSGGGFFSDPVGGVGDALGDAGDTAGDVADDVGDTIGGFF